MIQLSSLFDINGTRRWIMRRKEKCYCANLSCFYLRSHPPGPFLRLAINFSVAHRLTSDTIRRIQSIAKFNFVFSPPQHLTLLWWRSPLKYQCMSNLSHFHGKQFRNNRSKVFEQKINYASDTACHWKRTLSWIFIDPECNEFCICFAYLTLDGVCEMIF